MEQLDEVLRGRWIGNVVAGQGLQEGESFVAFWSRLRQERPDVAREVARLVLKRLAEGSGTEGQRQMLKEQAEREMGWAPATAYERYLEARRRGEWGPDQAVFAAGLPAGTERFTFEAFKKRARYPTVQQALDAVTAWLDDPRAPALLTLAGGPGTGKTHLALAAGWALARRASYVLFRTEPDLLAEVRRSFDRSPEDPVQTFRDCTWLIIDDVGEGAATPWGKGVLDQVVDQRWLLRARLLISTNAMNPQDLPARVGSRLSDTRIAQVVLIDAPDYRREPR